MSQPFSYPAPSDTAAPRRTPLLRRGWFIVLTAIVVVGVVSAVAGTLLRAALPAPTPPTSQGLEDIGETPPSFGGPSTGPSEGTFGVPARDGDVEFTVTGLECGVARVGDEGFGTDAVGQFCIVSYDVANVGAAPATITGFGQSLVDEAGVGYRADIVAEAQLTYPDLPSLDPLNPGDRRSERMVFDVPVDATPAFVELRGTSIGSPGVRIPLG